jgi:glycosyltransferase involved in cell wall biosynthesis
MSEIPLISFIIPVYNTSIDKVNRCLSSIFKIKELKFEIILVNDGSKEKYTQEYEKFVNKYSNLKYIYESNAGVGSARNKGISVSKGKYIFFVDSDDIIDDSPFNLNLKSAQSDLIIFNVTIKIEKTVKQYGLDNDKLINVSKSTLLRASIKNGLINWSVGKLYKRTVLQHNSIFFDKNKKTGEDLEFVVNFISKSKTIEYLPINSYYYYLSKDTAYSRYSKYPFQIIEDTLTTYKFRKNIISKFYDENREKEFIRISEEAVQSLFNVYVLQQNLNLEIYNKIVDIINEMPHKDNFNLINRIRIYILYSNNKLLLKMYRLLLKTHEKLADNK